MHLVFVRLLIAVSSTLFIYVNALPKAIPPKAFMVCGDSKIFLVDYMNSNDTNPKIIWQWYAHVAAELPEIYRTELFNTVDDCKSANNGKQILVSSSSRAVGIIDTESGRVIFYTRVPNGHSMELLPDNRLIAASSLDTDGNKLMLFDINQLDSKPLLTDTLESAHGLVWDNKRNRLYALGFNVSREYKMVSSNMLLKNNQWTI
jgi:WD40 repeat protein